MHSEKFKHGESIGTWESRGFRSQYERGHPLTFHWFAIMDGDGLCLIYRNIIYKFLLLQSCPWRLGKLFLS